MQKDYMEVVVKKKHKIRMKDGGIKTIGNHKKEQGERMGEIEGKRGHSHIISSPAGLRAKHFLTGNCL